jgi:hypothetical protein
VQVVTEHVRHAPVAEGQHRQIPIVPKERVKLES